MMRCISWFCSEHYGVFVPGDVSWQNTSPASYATAEMLELIGQPVKYFGRFTREARFCACAASVALRAALWAENSPQEIGLVSTGADGTLLANQEYFGDYVASGRAMGRGNLFIYTLPTSTLGEVAIALKLTGPCLFIQHDFRPVASLAKFAEQLLADGEAGGILALWSNQHATVCMAIDAGEDSSVVRELLAAAQVDPLQMIGMLRLMVQNA